VLVGFNQFEREHFDLTSELKDDSGLGVVVFNWFVTDETSLGCIVKRLMVFLKHRIRGLQTSNHDAGRVAAQRLT
jgi:hypothetical protein